MNEDPPTGTVDRGRLSRLAAYCLRSRAALVIAAAASVVAAAIGVVAPLVIRHVVDDVVGAGEGPLAPWIAVLAGLGIVSAALSFTADYAGSRLESDVTYGLRTDIVASLHRLDGPHQDRLRTGQVVSRSTGDVSAVAELLAAVPGSVASILQFGAVLIVMLLLSPALTAVVLLVLVAVYAAARHGARSFFPATWDVSHREGVVASIVEAAVTGVRVVKGFGREQDELRRLERASAALFASSMRAARLTVVYLPLFRYLPIVGQIGVLGVGGYLALHGHLSLGTFVAFSAYLAAAMGPMGELADRITSVQRVQASASRVFAVIDAEPDIRDPAAPEPVPPSGSGLELDHVAFGYRPGTPALTDVTLRIDPGERVALVGGTGSGKSTVALLLARFYDPWQGSVRVGGRDLRSLPLAAVRSRMGMVLEDNFLVSDTIGANIAFGRDAGADRIAAAAAAAGATEFIDALPDRYDTMVGERGLALSGGQRQRVALARAVLDDPDVLVLDDATSAVDAGVEAEIHAALRETFRGRTTLLIAHRRSTLTLADRIVVMDRGRVVDTGTHEELSARCSRYRLLLTGVDTDTDTTESASAAGITPEPWSRPAPEAFDQELTSDQQAMLAALPPARDVPGVDLQEAERADPAFGVRRLWPALRRGFLLSTGLVVTEAVLLLIQPWLTRHAIDRGVVHPSPATLWTMCALGLLAVGVIWVATRFNLRIVTRNSVRIRYLLRIKVFAHLQRLGLDFYDREPAGRIMTRMNGDPEAVQEFVSAWAGELVVRSLTFLGVVGLMLFIDARLAVAALASIPPFVLAVALYRRAANRAYAQVRDREGALNALLQEGIAGIRVTQAYGREDTAVGAYRAEAVRYRSAVLHARRLLAGFQGWAELCHQTALVVVVGLGAVFVRDGTLTPGGLIAFLLYVAMLFGPIMVLSAVVDGYQQARVGILRIRELLATPVTTPANAAATPLPELRGDIRFENVRFRYPARRENTRPDALRGIDLHVRPGRTLAIVGRTGAGKSTVTKLVARFYDPTSGTVRIDGEDLRHLDLAQFRAGLGFVPQESYLFEGTVRDVIAYARPDATDREIEAAARAVGAHEAIAALEYGYLHPVGEGGRNLSAGQRQLLALARAQLPDPPILLLDEATASLDLATEAAVYNATRRAASGRTTIVIAHRLTTAAAADRIVVLDDGIVCESGTHADLLAAGGEYARLWAAFSGSPDASQESSDSRIPISEDAPRK